MDKYPDSCIQTCVARERAVQLLHTRARNYHERAVQLEKLADWAAGLSEEQDLALWHILSESKY